MRQIVRTLVLVFLVFFVTWSAADVNWHKTPRTWGGKLLVQTSKYCGGSDFSLKESIANYTVIASVND